MNGFVWAVLAAAALWGTTGTVAHHAPAGSSQILVGLATFGFGGLVLFALDAAHVLRLFCDRASLARVAPLVGLGAVGVGLYAGCYYWSMSLVGVAIGNVLALGSGPVFAAILELVIERRRIGVGWVVATALSVGGIGLLGSSAAGVGGSSPALGVALALVSGFGYALYSWSAARLISRGLPSRPVMAAVFAAASLVLVPAFWLAGPGPLLTGSGPLILGYLALVPMAVSYLLFGYGLRGLAASTATTLALAEPIVATLLALVVLHEVVEPLGWVGLALIVAGILVIAATERAQAPGRGAVG